jgi:hypothetical protein
MGSDGEALLLEALPPPCRFSRLWRVVHAADFLLGGTTFIAGTVLLFAPVAAALPAPPGGAEAASAAVYTLGSLGFLAVDLQELASYSRREEALLRANIACSATGSALYVVGSLGYAPALAALCPQLGSAGFIGGSALIFASQLWKLARIAGDWRRARAAEAGALAAATDASGGAEPAAAAQAAGAAVGGAADLEAATAASVEGGACAGALLFLVGTALSELAAGQTAAGENAVLWLWLVGSLSFSVGGAALAYRHFSLGIA